MSRRVETMVNMRSFATEGSSKAMERMALMHLLHLTKTNYHHWTMIMECYHEVQGWWDVIEGIDVPQKKDCQALFVILKAISEEFLEHLNTKKWAKDNWEALHITSIGVERVV